jgi:hypothetical protein
MRPTLKVLTMFQDQGWTDSQLEAQGYLLAGVPQPPILEALRAAGWDDEAIVAAGCAEADAPAAKPDTKVERYITLRDEIARLTGELKKVQSPIKEEMSAIEEDLATVLSDQGQTTMSGTAATFFFVDKQQVGVENYSSFQKFWVGTIVIKLQRDGFLKDDVSTYDAHDCAMESMGLNFVTQAVRKEAVSEYISEYKKTPPGLKVETVREVQVRRPSTTKKK